MRPAAQHANELPRAADVLSSEYGQAERNARASLAVVEAASGRDSPETARAVDALVAALLEDGKAGLPETVALAQRAVSVKQRAPAPQDVDVALSLHLLASVYNERGDYAEAVKAHTAALTLRRRTLPADDARVADSLEQLAIPLILLEQFPAAQERIDEAARIRRPHGLGLPAEMATTLETRALLDRWSGNYGEGLRLIRQVLSMNVTHRPVDAVRIHQLHGDLLLLSGDIDAATSAWSTALDIAARALRPGHPAVVPLLRDLAVTDRASGNLARAQGRLESALAILTQSMAPCHPEAGMVPDDLAMLAEFNGDYERASMLYDTALAAFRACLAPDHSLTATVVHNKAILAADMGDLAEAERLHRQALQMWTRGLGAHHPYVARAMDALAQVLAARGNAAAARDLYGRALSLRRSTLGNDHPDVAWTLSNLAQVTGALGRTRLAVRYADEAIGIYQRAGVSDEPDHLARTITLRGVLLQKAGDFEDARASFADALAARETIFGRAHPLTAAARADVASAEFAIGNGSAALGSAIDAENTARDHLRLTIRYLPERQAMAYAAARPRGLDLALSVAAVTQSIDAAPVLDAVIQSRGVILDELAARARLTVRTADPQLTALNDTLIDARRRLANLMLRSLQGDEAVPAPLIEDARRQQEDAERALAERSVAAREEAERVHIGLDAVRGAMPPGSALVSFIRYERTSVVSGPAGRTITTTPSYIALVTRADTLDVRVVPLGTAASIERLVDGWRVEASGRAIAAGVAAREAERTYRAAAGALRARVWDPLARSLDGATRVFIVPDGALNLVSFAALPVGDRYLLERGPAVHYLSTERDLVRGAAAQGQGLLALGGPAFGGRAPAATASSTRRGGCGALGSLRFEDLPGSRAEVQDIARIWGAPDDVLVLSGRAATKPALISAIAGRRVIHLATHGFFLGNPCEPALPRTRGVGGIVGVRTTPLENPLLMAGLALAGVNAMSGARQSAGVLNAQEIAGLNLQGTEWAVLSACDTGLGQIAAGEGVFGLRRALQIAGVRTIIMSLWSVEDQSTRDWMKALYTARLTQQLDTPDAVRAAGLQLIEQRRKRGASTHPFYWAAFVAAGDWR